MCPIQYHTGVSLSYKDIYELVIKEFEKHKAPDYKDPRAILELVRDVVNSVQEVDNRIAHLEGHQKKELAADVIVWLVYDKYELLKIPYVPKRLEKRFFKFVLKRWIIDGMVEWAKNRFSK